MNRLIQIRSKRLMAFGINIWSNADLDLKIYSMHRMVHFFLV